MGHGKDLALQMKPEPWEGLGRDGMGLDLSLHRISLAVAGGLNHAGGSGDGEKW